MTPSLGSSLRRGFRRLERERCAAPLCIMNEKWDSDTQLHCSRARIQITTRAARHGLEQPSMQSR